MARWLFFLFMVFLFKTSLGDILGYLSYAWDTGHQKGSGSTVHPMMFEIRKETITEVACYLCVDQHLGVGIRYLVLAIEDCWVAAIGEIRWLRVYIVLWTSKFCVKACRSRLWCSWAFCLFVFQMSSECIKSDKVIYFPLCSRKWLTCFA